MVNGCLKRKIMKKQKGLTLIELLVVILIIGVLAAVAVPVYTNYLVRARRADAKTCLEQLRAAQEMRRAEQGSYSLSLPQLQNTWGVPISCGDYALSLNSATATSYLAQADPSGSPRQSKDGSLFINQDGVKTPADKWAK
jgi:type IV pilus assembly protein PilE